MHQDRHMHNEFLTLSPPQSFSHAVLTHMHADMHENVLIQNLITLQCHEE